MEQGEDRVDGLLAVAQTRHPRPALGGVGPQVAVAEHRALGGAGGAAGVLQERDVLPARARVVGRERAGGPDEPVPPERRRGGGRHGGAGGAGARQRQAQREALEPGQRRREVDRDDGLHRRARLRGEHRARGLVPRDDDPGAVVGELVLELGLGVQRVVLDDDRAQAQHGVESDDVLRAVRQDERDPVPGPDAEAGQRRRRPRDLVGEVRVRRRRAVEVERHARAEPLGRLVEQVDERAGRHVDVRGDPLGVAAEPGPSRGRRHAANLAQAVSGPHAVGSAPEPVNSAL